MSNIENIITNLRSELRSQKKLLSKIENQIEPGIEGSLVIRKVSEQNIRYYRYIKGNTPIEYLNSSKTELLSRLAQKRYDEQMAKTIRERINAIEKSLKPLEKLKDRKDLAHIYDDMPKELKQHIKPRMDENEEYAAKWQSKKLLTNSMEKKHPCKTLRGEYVRSKSEALIADRLFARGVPYHYEPMVMLTGRPTLCPDFYVLNKRTEENFFWEHLGMMDDPTYCNRNMKKIRDYTDMGYIQGKDLIITYETKEYPLDTNYIEKIIERLLK